MGKGNDDGISPSGPSKKVRMVAMSPLWVDA